LATAKYIELSTGERIEILHEDRSVLAIDKPRGWMLVPFSWQKTNRNLQAALTSSIAAKDFWARSRNIRFLRFVHRLDADTTGILLLAKSPGAVMSYGALFESRRMEKTYLAVTQGIPPQKSWVCRLSIGLDPDVRGKMQVDARHGKSAETRFEVLQARNGRALVEAHPFTGRTHQIRVHLAAAGCPVFGDELYSLQPPKRGEVLALRAVRLSYGDPFTRRTVDIFAPMEKFVRQYGFSEASMSSSAKNTQGPAPKKNDERS
jgi:23S rRNA pseudouridine1911/1915/1917 synthase